ncbi:MAG: GNAT family N-acetyltransferase [Proteobacteria bacterium]|nr:GNAT family N-acetyltransferase [Pseudomonadota bacterium]
MDSTARKVPVLPSERLRLRAPRLDDFPTSYALWSDPVVTRFIGGRPHTKEEVWARLLRYIGHWDAIGYGYWAVEAIASGAYVGEVGFSDYRRDIVPSVDGIPEIGWVLAAHAHGRGLASEAARAALAWRDAALPPGETVCIVAPEHAPSLRIAEKLGFGRPVASIYRGNARIVLRRETLRSR